MSTPLARVAPLDRPRMSTTLGRVVPKDRYSTSTPLAIEDPLNSFLKGGKSPPSPPAAQRSLQ